jgi:hypothetical protein
VSYARWEDIARGVIARKGRRDLNEPADLVHRVYEGLCSWRARDFPSTAAFWGFLSPRMERALIDLIREERAVKRGGRVQTIPQEDWSAWLEGSANGGPS